MVVQTSDTVLLFQQSPDPKVREMGQDIALITDLTKVLNASLALAEEVNTKGGLILALAQKGLATSEMAANASGASSTSAVGIGNFIVGQGLKTASMAKLMSLTPGRAGAAALFVVVEKTVSAAGFAGLNKCRTAVASLVATTGMAAVTAPTGVGAAIGALAIASDLFAMYGACYADGKDGRDLAF